MAWPPPRGTGGVVAWVQDRRWREWRENLHPPKWEDQTPVVASSSFYVLYFANCPQFLILFFSKSSVDTELGMCLELHVRGHWGTESWWQDMTYKVSWSRSRGRFLCTSLPNPLETHFHPSPASRQRVGFAPVPSGLPVRMPLLTLHGHPRALYR